MDEIVDEAIQLKIPAIWMQESVINQKAAEKARETAMRKADEAKRAAEQKAGEVKQTAERKVTAIRADPPPKTQLVAAAAIGLAIVAVVFWRKGSR